VIYLAFALWLILLVLTAGGVYHLWSQMLRPQWINWALLPGTVVSELSFMFGCLITGGEVRRAKLVHVPGLSKTGTGRAKSGEPQAESTARIHALGPIEGVLPSLLACLAVLAVLCGALGRPVVVRFIGVGEVLPGVSLPRTLATSWAGLWDQVAGQVDLLRRMSETWGRLDWLDWRVPLFVYLSICLSVRLAPPNRPLRTKLLAAGLVAVVAAVIGLVTGGRASWVSRFWPVLTYTWTTLLFVLVVTLVVRGLVLLGVSVAGKPAR